MCEFATSVDDLIAALRAVKSEHAKATPHPLVRRDRAKTKERIAKGLALLAEQETKETAAQ